jgi:bifunctional ADP-heptose synthase (sugar kinase/adenylyltransferase)
MLIEDCMFRNLKIAVVGDVMLDHWIVGTVERISQEASVLILEKEEEEYNLGGAANVAANVAGLGAKATLFGVLGLGERKVEIIMGLAREHNIEPRIIVDRERKTTIKQRVASMKQQLLRIDYEDRHPIKVDHEDCIIEGVQEGPFDAVILSDYNKGVLTQRVCQEIIRNHELVTVDPKYNNWLKYQGCKIITPNEKEFGGHDFYAEYTVVTIGDKGAKIINKDMNVDIPAVAVGELRDVSGAGDTFIAALTCKYAKRYTYSKTFSMEDRKIMSAVEFANKCAGIVVTKKGVVPIKIEEVENE